MPVNAMAGRGRRGEDVDLGAERPQLRLNIRWGHIFIIGLLIYLGVGCVYHYEEAEKIEAK